MIHQNVNWSLFADWRKRARASREILAQGATTMDWSCTTFTSVLSLLLPSHLTGRDSKAWLMVRWVVGMFSLYSKNGNLTAQGTWPSHSAIARFDVEDIDRGLVPVSLLPVFVHPSRQILSSTYFHWASVMYLITLSPFSETTLPTLILMLLISLYD
jgi:hypothetical protein